MATPGARADDRAGRRLRSTRLRIVGSSAALLALGLLAATLAARQVLLWRLDERIDRQLAGQVQRLRTLVEGRLDPRTGRPFTGIGQLLRVDLAGVSGGRNQTVLVFVDGRPYGQGPGSPPLRLEGGLAARWGGIRTPERGTVQTSAGAVRYAAVPVVPVRGGPSGVLVAATLRDLQRAELDDTLMVASGAGCTGLLLAWLLAWVAAGRVLAPLRAAGDTAVLQRELLDDVGHELRIPITVIRGHLDVLGDDPQERRETMAIVSDELDRINHLVEELLLLSSADRPGFLRLQPVDIGGLTVELLAKARALGDRDWRLEAAGAGAIVADRRRLTQAVLQLAHNAVQQTAAGAPIGLGSAVAGSSARFWVRDHGPGIAEADQRRIFDRFVRAAGPGGPAGTGIGLAIVRAITQAHHGRVELRSRRGAGALFTLVVPVAPPGWARERACR